MACIRRPIPIQQGLSAICDAVDGTGLVVRNQQAAVGQDLKIDRPPPGAVVLEPALGEDLVGDRPVVPEQYLGDTVSCGLAAVPGTVFGDEYPVAVVRWEHVPGIESHSQRGDMGTKLHLGGGEFILAVPLAELGVG